MNANSSKPGISSSLALGGFAIAWSAIVSLAAVPWYIRLLGIESYGLIGFYATLQAAMSLLDLGLGATISREVARSAALDELGHARRLLRSLEFVYVGIMAIIATLLVAAAPLIASEWLGSSGLDQAAVCQALRLIGVVVALRWPIGLYLGVLVGLHRAQISYRVTATMTTLANVGAILVLLYASRTLWAYFVWQAASALLYVFWARRSAWQHLGDSDDARFDWTLLKGVLVQSVMMSGVAMTGLILTQLDKIVVSSSTTLADFGHYALAGVLATGLSVLIIPTYNVIYPQLSALVAAGRPDEQVSFYRLGTRLFLSCLAPVALSAYFYSYDLIALWTGNAALAVATAPIAGLLLLGSALNGIMLFPYAMQLAKGQTTLPFLINCVLAAIMLPMALVLVRHYGALGGALTWFWLNAIFVVIGSTVTHFYILPELRKKWILLDVAPAVLIAALIVTGGHSISQIVGPSHLSRLVLAAFCSIAATAVMLFLFRDARTVVIEGCRTGYARLRRSAIPSDSNR